MFCTELAESLITLWRHQMETFSAFLALCVGNSPITGEFLAQRPVTRSFDVFFDMRLNIRLSKQWWGWWFEAPSHPLWRHCNEEIGFDQAWQTSLSTGDVRGPFYAWLVVCHGGIWIHETVECTQTTRPVESTHWTYIFSSHNSLWVSVVAGNKLRNVERGVALISSN